jgi:hypothetical protein
MATVVCSFVDERKLAMVEKTYKPLFVVVFSCQRLGFYGTIFSSILYGCLMHSPFN